MAGVHGFLRGGTAVAAFSEGEAKEMAETRLTTLAERNVVRELTHWDAEKRELSRDGHERVFFEVVIDEEILRRLGKVAAGNKNGRCKRGPLTVRVTRREAM